MPAAPASTPPYALLMHSGCPGISSTSSVSEAGIAIYRAVHVRRLFERLEHDYGTFISGISIPFEPGRIILPPWIAWSGLSPCSGPLRARPGYLLPHIHEATQKGMSAPTPQGRVKLIGRSTPASKGEGGIRAGMGAEIVSILLSHRFNKVY